MSEQQWTFLSDSANIDRAKEYDTLITAFEDNGEQRRRKNLNQRRTFKLRYEQVLKDQVKDMEEFFDQMFGRFDNFLFETEADSPLHKAEIISTALGSTSTFDLFEKNIIALTETIFLDGVAQVRDTDYAINNSTGVITYLTGDPAGTTLSAGTYRFRHRVRFDSDSFEAISLFREKVFSVNVTFKQEVGC